MVLRVLNTLSARLATPFRWLMVAGIAYTLATSVTYLIAGPETAPAVRPSTDDRSPPSRATVDIEPLLARNLFGAAGAGPVASQTAAPAAVATQLPLELRGVFAAQGDGVSAAIIAQRGSGGMLYVVGQEIAGSATLESVAADHVILRRAGVAERLNFPKVGQGWTAQASVEPPSAPLDVPYEAPAADQEMPVETEPYEQTEDPDYQGPAPEPEAAVEGAAASPGDLVAKYREDIAARPEQTLQSLGFSPVSAGAASGYRIDNLAQVPYLGQTGLQPGDVILSVNGRPVGDLSQDRLEVDNVLAQGSARIEVQRGTRRFFVTASLP